MENERGATSNFTGPLCRHLSSESYTTVEKRRRQSPDVPDRHTSWVRENNTEVSRTAGPSGNAGQRSYRSRYAGKQRNEWSGPSGNAGLLGGPSGNAGPRGGLAATPAATLGSGEASRPLSFSKPLFLYIYVLVFDSPLYVLLVPSLLFSFLSNKMSSAPTVTGASM
jgi:hypothetical protein